MAKKEKKIIYYSDQLHDDFAFNKIKTKTVKEDYKYIHKNIFFRMFSWFLRYIIAVPVLSFVTFFCAGTRIYNKKVLKEVKHKGYFLYANHTQTLDPCIHAVRINPFKYTCIIASHDAFSINPFVTFLVKSLGGIPIPNTKNMYAAYLKTISYHIEKKHNVLIYPEKHIWPFYKDIRDFTADTFRYPVLNKAPIVVATTCYKKVKLFKKPRLRVFLDGPFYPNLTIPYRDSVTDLRNVAFENMKKRAAVDWNFEYISYKKS
ncbi:MAG: 1-acyl-sn-glycerol-3-phosphate acyltransferase [Bacilli bacterium]